MNKSLYIYIYIILQYYSEYGNADAHVIFPTSYYRKYNSSIAAAQAGPNIYTYRIHNPARDKLFPLRVYVSY